MSRSKIPSMITDSNQGCSAKMTDRSGSTIDLGPFKFPETMTQNNFVSPKDLPLFPSNRYSEVIFALQNITLSMTLK
jgi:hypothetical protein